MWTQSTEFKLGSVFPTETYERIIDFIMGPDLYPEWLTTQSDLFNCALTCRAWLPRSRLLLYSTVHLTSGIQLSKFEHSLAARPNNGGLVRTLVIHSQGVQGEIPTWIHPLSLRLPRLLYSVRTLDIQAAEVPDLHPDFFRAVTQFRTITSLRMSNIRVKNINQFARLVLAFPNLSALHFLGPLDGIGATDSQIAPHLVGKHRSRKLKLRELELDSRFEDGGRIFTDIAHWLSIIPASYSFEKLALHFHTDLASAMSVGTHIERLLHACGPSLRELALRLGPGCGFFDLSSNMNLHVLHLLIDPLLMNSDGLNSLVDMLSGISSQSLSYIALKLELSGDVRDFESPSWEAIDGILTHPPFVNLRRLQITARIVFGDDTQAKEMTRLLSAKVLPNLHARGMLEIDCYGCEPRSSENDRLSWMKDLRHKNFEMTKTR